MRFDPKKKRIRIKTRKTLSSYVCAYCGKENLDWRANRKKYCNRECYKKAFSLKLKHYNWMEPWKHIKCGPANHNWKGGKTVSREGYILIKVQNHPRVQKTGYVFEHRLVMEKHLGRYLKKEEVVHHKNGKVGDNRLENLEAK